LADWWTPFDTTISVDGRERGDVVGAHYGLDRLAAALAGHPVPVDMAVFAALQADYAEHGLAALQG